MPPFDTLTPPTDNLYKFIAIFGLIGLLAGVGATVYQTTELEKYGLVDDISSANFLVAIHDVRNADAEVKNAKPADQAQAAQDLAASKTRLSSAQVDFIKSQNGVWAATQDEINRIRGIGWLIWGGFSVSVLGFVLWYGMVQCHEDQILRAKAAEARRKLKHQPPGEHR